MRKQIVVTDKNDNRKILFEFSTSMMKHINLEDRTDMFKKADYVISRTEEGEYKVLKCRYL